MLKPAIFLACMIDSWKLSPGLVLAKVRQLQMVHVVVFYLEDIYASCACKCTNMQGKGYKMQARLGLWLTNSNNGAVISS